MKKDKVIFPETNATIAIRELREELESVKASRLGVSRELAIIKIKYLMICRCVREMQGIIGAVNE